MSSKVQIVHSFSLDTKLHRNRTFCRKGMNFGTLVLKDIKINFKIGSHPSDSPGFQIVEKERVKIGV